MTEKQIPIDEVITLLAEWYESFPEECKIGFYGNCQTHLFAQTGERTCIMERTAEVLNR